MARAKEIKRGRKTEKKKDKRKSTERDFLYAQEKMIDEQAPSLGDRSHIHRGKRRDTDNEALFAILTHTVKKR